jgi:hypothetical protein
MAVTWAVERAVERAELVVETKAGRLVLQTAESMAVAMADLSDGWSTDSWAPETGSTMASMMVAQRVV